MIYLTSTPLNNSSYQLISDLQTKMPKITNTRFYFIFIDGKITLPFYKNLLEIGYEEIIIYVKNIELFKIVFNPHTGFDADFEWKLFPENRDFYYDIEDNIKNKLIKDMKRGRCNKKRNNEVNKKYLDIIGELDRDAIELSFYPRIFDSIRTSLLKPELYMTESNRSSILFQKAMKGKIKIEEIDDVETLNSLLYAKILVAKNGFVSVNDLLL